MIWNSIHLIIIELIDPFSELVLCFSFIYLKGCNSTNFSYTIFKFDMYMHYPAILILKKNNKYQYKACLCQVPSFMILLLTEFLITQAHLRND